MIELQSTITCPHCGHQHTETMPADFCQFFYDCQGCGAVLRPEKGDCCVFCTYGTVPCPPIQAVVTSQPAMLACIAGNKQRVVKSRTPTK